MAKSHTAKLTNITLMAGICKDICKKYMTTKRYKQGVVRCNYCDAFLKWEGIWCPCCRCRVRGKPRYVEKGTRGETYLRVRRRIIFDECLWAWKHEKIHHETRKRYIWLKNEPTLEDICYNCFKPLFKT